MRLSSESDINYKKRVTLKLTINTRVQSLNVFHLTIMSAVAVLLTSCATRSMKPLTAAKGEAAYAKHGMVASVNSMATEAGVNVLKNGGEESGGGVGGGVGAGVGGGGKHHVWRGVFGFGCC